MKTQEDASIHTIVIGASLGGIEAGIKLLQTLPDVFPAAILMVQHQKADGGNRLADLFQRHCQLPVVAPCDKQKIERGRVYVAPPGYHTLVGEGGIVHLSLSAPVHYCRPAIDELFYSAGHIYGSHLMGILLTGANADGAAGLHYIKKRKGITIAQTPDTAEAPAMPQAAINMAAAMQVLPVEEIAIAMQNEVIGKEE